MKKCFCFVIAAMTMLYLFQSGTLHAKKKDVIVSLVPTDTLRGAINFNSVQVIDARKDKTNIGSPLGSKWEIKTPDSLSVHLQNFVQSMMAPEVQKGNQDLLVIVRNFRLQDIVKGQPFISTILIDMDCYLGKNGMYVPVVHYDSLYERRLSKEPIQVLAYISGYFFTQTIKEAAIVQPQPGATAKSIATILSEEDLAKQNIPIYSQAPKAGIYYTIDQFKNNTPGDIAFYHDHFFTGDTHIDRFYLSSEKKKKEKDLSDTVCFAVFNGEKWYRPYTANTFKEMKMTDGDFYYFGISNGLKVEDYSSIAGVGYPYGAIGALLTTGIANVLNENERGKPPVYDDALFRMRLDPLTGKGKKLERVR
jgi:hypothetical protein